MICINSNNEHGEKFCPNCGEKSNVPKITFKTILSSLFSTITYMDKGFLFNVKNLFLNPSKTINDFIKGRRKTIFNPISFLIISISIYLIGESLIGFSGEAKGNMKNSDLYSVGKEAGRFTVLFLSIISVVVFSVESFVIAILIALIKIKF